MSTTQTRSKIKSNSAGYISQNSVKLIRGGKPYFDMLLHMINHARESIQLQVYLFDDDETGKIISNALTDAAGRNVEVFLMTDGYASQKLSRAFIQGVRSSGIHFRFFEPLLRNRKAYIGRRLHHKVIVTDNRYAMVGGINISNHYNDMPGQPGWLDFALHIEGEIVKDICRLCKQTWAGFISMKRISPCRENPTPFQIPAEEDCQLRLRRNDWVLKKNQISKSYVEMFRRANHQIIMMSGYFLPGRIIRKNLKDAVRRGVKVKLILAGFSDVMVAKNAERYMYDWVFRNNIELYEYKPRVLHGKVSVYDSQWATIGSYNVNDISAYASIELNVDVNNPGFAKMLNDELEKIIENDCMQITKENFDLHRGILNRIWENICYGFIRFLFFIFTFNFKQQN